MERLRRVLAGAGVLLCFLQAGSAMKCSRENIWGQTEYFYCPDDGDSSKQFCCGFDDSKYCCSSPIDEELLDDLLDRLPTILGVLACIVLVTVVLCIVCCCCCPFCLLYKRRHRGTVHNPNPDVSVMQPLQNQPHAYAPQPQAYAPQPQAAPYPAQPGYAPQPAPYPVQPGYAPQPYPPQGYPGEQPPMYTEKQPPPYNPTY